MDTFNLKKYISEKKIYKKESNLRESLDETKKSIKNKIK
jgi:hypothetical protein